MNDGGGGKTQKKKQEETKNVANLQAVHRLRLCVSYDEGLVKLIERAKIADSFLQSVSNQFHVIILSLPL